MARRKVATAKHHDKAPSGVSAKAGMAKMGKLMHAAVPKKTHAAKAKTNKGAKKY